MSFWEKVRALFEDGATSVYPNIEQTEKVIGYTFRDRSFLCLALTHRSFSHNQEKVLPSNERLEFLGDSVLGLVIADRLYHDYPDEKEGALTKMKSLLVNETALSDVSREVGLNQFILLSEEESKSGGASRPSIVSDAFESVIGAVYLDGGYEAAADIVLRLIYARKDAIVTNEAHRNYKGEFLEMVQAKAEGMPRYEVISEEGPDHDKVFHVAVRVAGRDIGTGVGSTKKEAEQRAAAMALQRYTL